ncbi:MAG: hypothetical protein NW216_08860 [Hyphomicrobium sp.]|nr:hypothetical protein [Hyphomicrobium sp.]
MREPTDRKTSGIVRKSNTGLRLVEISTLAEIARNACAARGTELVVICRRVLADAVSLNAALDGARHVEVLISRGLERDGAVLQTRASDAEIWIDGSMVGVEIETASATMARRLRLLAGYDLEAAVWQPAVEGTIRDRLASWGAARPGRVSIVALPEDVAVLEGLWPGLPIEGREASRPKKSKASAAKPALPDRPLPVDPDISTVARHAEFLATTDFEAVREMHRDIAQPAYASIFEIWLGNLETLARTDPTNRHAAAAANVMSALAPSTEGR